MGKLKILFFGLGSIGKRHVSILNQYHNVDLYAIRTNKGQEKHNLSIEEFFDIDEAFGIKPDICFITNPTSLHIQTALECAKRNASMFIEKPISNTYVGVDRLKKLVYKKNLIAYVAYNMRFHPMIEYFKQTILTNEENPIYFRMICSSYLPSWRPSQNYEKSYSSNKEMGGGVIFDISHEIDYINWIFGDICNIDGYYGHISKLEIDSEDVAEMQFKCKNGIHGSLHLNYFSHNTERRIQLYYDSMYIEGDILNNKITTYKNGKIVDVKVFFGNRDDTFIKQMDYFLEQYKLNNVYLMNNLKDASKVFKEMIKFKNKKCI